MHKNGTQQIITVLVALQGGATTHPDGEVVVCQRPGLAEFLARASEVAELVVFTAGMPGAHVMTTTPCRK